MVYFFCPYCCQKHHTHLMSTSYGCEYNGHGCSCGVKVFFYKDCAVWQGDSEIEVQYYFKKQECKLARERYLK